MHDIKKSFNQDSFSLLCFLISISLMRSDPRIQFNDCSVFLHLPKYTLTAKMESKSDFTNFDACLLILTEIVLPSTDVISDLLLIIQLTTYIESETQCYDVNCLDLNTLGYMMIIPLILSTILLVPHWWKNERSIKHKLLTLPFLILQFWPQYRVFRILWLKYIKKNVEWSVEELRIIKGTIGNIGKLRHDTFLLFILYFLVFCRTFC